MTKKDFEFIASVIRRELPVSDDLRMTIAETFAKELARANPKFDRRRFELACLPKA